ncbi:UNVERIFIED_ORG: putative PD-(D/E)XK family protein DUF4420 [Gordonia westfalica J30]
MTGSNADAMTPTGSPDDARLLNLATLDALWTNKAQLDLPITGTPTCRLQIDPDASLLRLITPYGDPEPDVTRLKNVRFEAISSDGTERGAITIQVDDNLHGAYGLLSEIADELQIRKSPLALGVANAVIRHRNMFANRGSLTTEREVGVVGELMFLDFLIHTIGAGPAIESWHGPGREEHDFVFDNVHIELKTTSTERRKHVIHGFSQLVPVGDTPLLLLSVQLTRAPQNAGLTLTQLVAKVRAVSGGHVVALNEGLEANGWSDDDADLYSTAWTFRTQPRAYAVHQSFPALTSDRLSLVVPAFERVSNLSYSIDVTDMPHGDLPSPLNGFTEPKGR